MDIKEFEKYAINRNMAEIRAFMYILKENYGINYIEYNDIDIYNSQKYDIVDTYIPEKNKHIVSIYKRSDNYE